MADREEKIDIEKLYGREAFASVEEWKEEQNIDVEKGLNSAQVADNSKKYGKNEMKQKKPKKWYHYFVESLTSPFNLILLGITVVLFYTDVYLSSPPSYANITVILLLVIISTLLEFFEVYRSNQAAEKLKSMVEAKATVLRDGKEQKIPMSEIVVGDILLLYQQI